MKHFSAGTLSRIGIVSLIAAGALLVLYAFWGIAFHGHIPLSNDDYAPVCTYADKSFCATEARFKQDMNTTNPSDILAAEHATSVICLSASAQPACATIQAGTAITVFRLVQNSIPALMMRNQFIALFRTYSVAHGPFHFVATTTAPSGTKMAFLGRDNASWSFLFTKVNGIWQLQEPVFGM